ncbi:MAG: carboxypeptidase-like regulatory domain-containing protein, partial [Acidobacteriota bacterium]|nr:carboxypeptidase-like regulatory domain-containing protein [Acidobacteriota bacterium]
MRTVTVFAIIALAVVAGLTQTHLGSIRGTVTDSTDARIVGATVEIVNTSTNIRRVITTSGEGAFVISQLPPGEFDISIGRDGYKTYVSHVVLQVSQRLRLDAQLELGVVTEQVIVTAPDTPIELDSSALTTVIDNQQIVQLPLDGRNFLELALLAAGTSPSPQGSAASVRGDFAMSVNGARENANAFL